MADIPHRASDQVVRVEAAGGRGLQLAQVYLRSEARMDGVATTNADRGTGSRQLLDLHELLPDHAGDRPCTVSQLQAQIVAAVPPLPALGLADHKDLVDLRAVGELVHEHDSEGKRGCGRDTAAMRSAATWCYFIGYRLPCRTLSHASGPGGATNADPMNGSLTASPATPASAGFSGSAGTVASAGVMRVGAARGVGSAGMLASAGCGSAGTVASAGIVGSTGRPVAGVLGSGAIVGGPATAAVWGASPASGA